MFNVLKKESEINKLPIGRGKKVLILQGPVGPFFSVLQKCLNKAGYDTKRVLFHAADSMFCNNKDVVKFRGNKKTWRDYLFSEFQCNKPDLIVMFGSSRPAHIIAREIAKKFNIQVVSLEEGYLRSGYVTCEEGGNNQYSQLATNFESLINDDSMEGKAQEHPQYIGQPLTPVDMKFCRFFFSFLFYGLLSVIVFKKNLELQHRSVSFSLIEIRSWSSHYLLQAIAKVRDKKVIQWLMKKNKNNFIIIPLQTPADTQITTASRGWSNEKLVDASIQAILDTKTNQFFVFKTHPLDNNSSQLKRYCLKRAKEKGVSKQVVVLKSGKLSELTESCSSMIVINSTSAFSALHRYKPLLVLGDSIYRHSSVATLGSNQESINNFVLYGVSKKYTDISNYLSAVRKISLVPGDFYAISSVNRTAWNVVYKINSLNKGALKNV